MVGVDPATWEAPNSPSSHSQSAPAFPTLSPRGSHGGAYIRTGLHALRHHSLTSVSLHRANLSKKAHSSSTRNPSTFHLPPKFLSNDSPRPRVPSFDKFDGRNRFSVHGTKREKETALTRREKERERERGKMAATMMMTEHVLYDFEVSDVFENELNDNLYNLKMSEDNKIVNKRSKRRRILKPLKPLLRMLKKRTSSKYVSDKHQEAVPQVEIFTEEVDNQNNANEALECRLLQELQDAEEGAAITVCLDGQMTVVPVVPGQCYVPVHFAHTHAGDFYWTTLSMADRDLCYKERAFSQHQLPEVQVA